MLLPDQVVQLDAEQKQDQLQLVGCLVDLCQALPVQRRSMEALLLDLQHHNLRRY